MAEILITDKGANSSNFRYLLSTLSELFSALNCSVKQTELGARTSLLVSVPDDYFLTAQLEICDRLAEIIAVNYKYNFFKDKIKSTGLNQTEREILFASLISADFEEDKSFAFNKLKGEKDLPLDGLFNFRMKPLKTKWQEIVSCMPSVFMPSQLCDFIGFLIESRTDTVFIDCGKVYDSHYRRLNRSMLMGEWALIKEVLLSNGGKIDIYGEIPETDEKYLKEFFTGKMTFKKDFIGKRS